LENLVSKAKDIKGSRKPWQFVSLHLDAVIGEIIKSESSGSSVQVYERPELEYIHPVVVYHLISRLKRNKKVTLKDL
jgi:vacuolar-type H+-ATPase catalytic subunit A/Vma1